MNPHVWQIIAQAAVQVAQIFIEKWINAKDKEQRQMNPSAFQEHELITRKVKFGNEWQTRTFPVVGGRLRLAHEGNGKLSLQTELVNWNGDYAVFKCVALTEKGQSWATAPPTTSEMLESQRA